MLQSVANLDPHVEHMFVEQIAFYKPTNATILLNNLVQVEQELLMNNESVITMAVAETEALAGAEKLVARTSRQQTGTHNNQL
jgi:hypothetical protein